MVKLYEGCWGVTRDWLPQDRVIHIRQEEVDASGRVRWVGRWEDRHENGSKTSWMGEIMLGEIRAVFPTREAAEAWLNRKRWWKRVLRWIIHPIHYWFIVAIFLLTWLSISCTPIAGPGEHPKPSDSVAVGGLGEP